MMKRMTALLLAILLVPACTTRKQMASRPSDAGIKASYDAPLDKVKRASKDALGEMFFKPYKESAEGERMYLIHASKGLSTASTGQMARVTIEDLDGKRTVYVYVESKAGGAEAKPGDDAVAKELQQKIASRLEK